MNAENQYGVRLIILGAGKPFQGEQHSVLRGATGHRRVLDWLLNAMRDLAAEIHFIGGYQVDEVAEHYPDLHYTVNSDWSTTGAAASLLQAPLSNRHFHYVSFSDVLYRASAVKALDRIDSDVAILVDSHWRSRFRGRSKEDLARCEKVNLHGTRVTRLGRDLMADMADAEFVGLVRLSPHVTGYIDQHRDEFPASVHQGSLSQFVEVLRMRGFSVEAVDVLGDWAEMNEPDDLSRFILGTKAQTLQRLQGMLTQSRIENQVSFTVAEWERAPDSVLSDIRQRLANSDTLVVRSSALSEDGFGVSNAGAYTSVLNVDRHDADTLTGAISEVIASYPDGHPDNQVLVQPMLQGVTASGVAFTRVLATGAPYYVINYDDTTSSTESITSGVSREHKTLFLHRDTLEEHVATPANLVGLVPALREIETLLDFDSLDVEFAMTRDGIHILQVRPIAVQHELDAVDTARNVLAQAVKRFQQLSVPGPFVVEGRPLFGIMPDWNPAEIIGTRPGRLAASLYRFLILDDVWARQRAEYGYRDVRPQPLMTLFAGHPYIDVRASFNSFIPASLDDGLAARLVTFYLDWLVQRPQLHDKVEFDVVPTCYALDFDHWQQRLEQAGGFDKVELSALAEGLKGITRGAFQRTPADLAAINTLHKRFSLIRKQSLPDLDSAVALLEDCRRVGTLTFAHLARSGFVAVTLLRSAVVMGILSQTAVDDFLNSIRTVSHRFTEDAGRVARREMSFDRLVAHYGHLRPGTYDITSASYADDPDRYLQPVVIRAQMSHAPRAGGDSGAWVAERQEFFAALAEAGLPSGPDEVEAFLHGAIEGRERAKFEFTRYLSLALDRIARFGDGYGLARGDMAQVSLEDLLAFRAGDPGVVDPRRWLQLRAQEGVDAARTTALIELPPLISCHDDFYGFLYADSHANFIGRQRVLAECVDLRQLTGDDRADDLSGRIALIPQADPGYDWLFGHDIAGLVTMYGGANSHMAIRAAEFGLPAAIGIGEARFLGLAGATFLELDPSNRRLEVVR